MLAHWWLPRYEPNAVEANQAEFRAEPEIAVGRLSNRVYGPFEKAFADHPNAVCVLIDAETCS
jgi:hypothetical protein